MGCKSQIQLYELGRIGDVLFYLIYRLLYTLMRGGVYKQCLLGHLYQYPNLYFRG